MASAPTSWRGWSSGAAVEIASTSIHAARYALTTEAMVSWSLIESSAGTNVTPRQKCRAVRYKASVHT